MSVSGIWMSGYCDLRGISKELPKELPLKWGWEKGGA